MKQIPLSGCGYYPDLMLFGVRSDINTIAEKYGFQVESFWQDGLGPTDAIFVIFDSGASCVLYRYKYGAMPYATVFAGDPGLDRPSVFAREVISAFGFEEADICEWGQC